MSTDLPHELDAERHALAAILRGDDSAWSVVEILRSEDFFLDAHQQLFEAMSRVLRRRSRPSFATMRDVLMQEPTFTGSNLLDDLASLDVSATRAIADARLVRERSLARRLIREAQEIAETAREQKVPVDEIVDSAVERMLEVRRLKQSHASTSISVHVRKVFSSIETLYEKHATLKRLSTGFPHLDELTLGLLPGEVMLLAGNPQAGKSSLALHMARHAVLEEGVPVALFPLSLSGDDVTLRLMAAGAGIPHRRLRNGRLEDADWPKLAKAADRLFRAPMLIGDARKTSITEVHATSAEQKAKSGRLGLIVVDDLHLLPAPARSSALAQLEEIARDLEVPVIATIALPSDSGRPPTLAGLRTAGVAEAHAALIVFIHRAAQHADESGAGERIDLTVAKNEKGLPETVSVCFHAERLCFDY